jgi:hypothetical protein|tara:strand:+ start:5953 stop:6141 length:189 start_codon:yes stop_codon:yes gene_type:complete
MPQPQPEYHQSPAAPEKPDGVPPYLVKKLAAFLTRGATGNFTLNIKDGKVVGGRLEELLKQA